MTINNELIKAILQQLNEVSPRAIDAGNDDARSLILPEHTDREEIREYLDHCEREGYITFKKWAGSGDYPEGKLSNIRITQVGIEYLAIL